MDSASKEIKLNVTIKSNGTEMVISTLGAEPQSLKRDGIEYIWQGDKAFWFRRAPLLFPTIGATPDGKITAKGREYTMPNNGFARDVEWKLESAGDSSAAFILEDDEEIREKYYPFGFSIRVTYTVEEDGYRAKAEIHAKEDIWYTFGWHPAFSLDINGKGTELETYTVSFEQNERCDRKYAKDGVFVVEKDFLTGDSIDLSREETDKGAIILEGIRSREVTLTSSAGEHGVTAYMGDMPVLTIWTVEGKKAQFVCIEPMLSFGDRTRAPEIEKMAQSTMLPAGSTAVYENAFRIF